MQDKATNPSATRTAEWGAVVKGALDGDPRAYARLARLVTGHLAHWRGFDFRPDWDDMVQEVLLAVMAAYREGRLTGDGQVAAYLRQTTRFKFIDRIRASKRAAPDADPIEVADGPGSEAPWPPRASIGAEALAMRMTLIRALENLPERERLAVAEVHVRGNTYEEAAAATGIPLGSLKRSLRTGLARLREEIEARQEGSGEE